MTVRNLAALALALAATGADAQDAPLLVSVPDTMCPALARGEDVQELGMVLTARGMWEIEYFCEFQPELDIHWRDFRTVAQLAVCAEPGRVEPAIFAIQMFQGETGTVRVWAQGGEEPTVFQSCPD